MSFVAATGVVLTVLGLALVFGGTAALSFAAAPQTFRSLKSVDAGRVFGKVLRVFDAMAAIASIVAIVGGVLAMAETVSVPRIALVVIASSLYASITFVRRVIAPKMAALKPPETEDEERRWDPDARRRFDALHKLYVRLYACNLFLSLVGLVIAVLPLR